MASTSVNRPVNEKVKELDINNKLQLYGIYSAFSNGKVPSNKQIDVALNSALASRPLSNPSKRLSEEGHRLVADLRDVIEQAKLLVLTKNEGNLFQDFVWQTQQVSGGTATAPNAPVDKATAKQHGNEALDGLRTLGTLIISNGQFRKLLKDASILFRDIAGDAAQKAATKVNPNETELAQIDHAAEDNTWHEVPDFSRDNIRNTIKTKYSDNKPFGRSDIDRAAGDAAQAAHPDGLRDPAAVANLAAQDQQYGTASGLDSQAGARAGYDTLQGAAKANIPDEAQDRAKNYKGRTATYLKGKMPQERREQTIWRLKKMIVEIQGHQDYQRAVDTLLRLAEEYTGHGRTLAQHGQGAVKGAHTDDSLQMAEADLKTLIERFANSTSLDDLFESINQIYRDAEKDPELKGWFKQIDSFIRRALKTQGYIMQEEATEEWNQLYDHGNYLLRDRYRNHTDRITDEFKFIGTQFDEDPQNTAFANSLKKLFMDLGNDENGKPTFKPHLIKDLTEVILPALFEHVQYIPIPRIEYSDPSFDAVVENLVIESDNLTPNVLEFGSDNYWRWGRKQISSKNKNKVMLSVSGVQMDIRDVSYYVTRKQGFPSITDKGVVDVFMGGTGLSFKVEMETADKNDSNQLFKVNKVSVDIKNLKIKVKKSNHKLLFALVKPILLKVMRPMIEKIVGKQITDNINELDRLAYAVRQEVKRAEADAMANPDPENVQNIYQRYVAAVNKQILEGKQKKEQLKAKTADKKANMAITQHDSIFPQVQLPGGISTKATEYKELAAKGDKWETPVFSLGSAKETTNLPKIAAIQRKTHNVTSGGLRGREPGLSGAAQGAAGAGYGADSGYAGQANPQFNPALTAPTAAGYAQPPAAAGYAPPPTTGYAQPPAPAGYTQPAAVPYTNGQAKPLAAPNGGAFTDHHAQHSAIGGQNPAFSNNY